MILSQILQEKVKVVEARKELRPLASVRAELAKGLSARRDFKRALLLKSINLIAEVKRQSPSKGVIRTDFRPVQIATDYAAAGAQALSVLTDEKFFGGELAFVGQIRKVVDLPILQKDFIIDEYQIYEAALAGADAILLIADILDNEKLARFMVVARETGLETLCETRNEDDLRRALTAGAEIIGINNRDLHTFIVDIGTTRRLVPLIPQGKIIVAESGIRTREDVIDLKKLGVNAVLVGEALMSAGDAGAKVRELMGYPA